MCTEKELHSGCFAGTYAKTFKAAIFPKHQRTDALESSNSLFLEHQWTLLDELIAHRREISICSKVVLMP